MKKRRSIQNNTIALAMIYDTLLFLTFISLAGILLLPAFLPDNQLSTSKHLHQDQFVEETLQQLVITTAKEFNYTLAGDIIDSFALSIGINTSQSKGLYRSVTQWILGKQQYHKTYGELLADLLFCKMEFQLDYNHSITLNPLTKDYEHQLIQRIQDFLDSQIHYPFHYYFEASWMPIKNIDIGGTIELGLSKPLLQHSYTATQTLNIPILPILHINDSYVIFTEQWIQDEIQDIVHTDTICKNITKNAKMLNGFNEYEEQFNYYINCQQENITTLALHIICDGIKNSNNSIVIPGILESVVNAYLSDLIKLNKKDQIPYSSDSIGYGFNQFDEFISDCAQTEDHPFQSFLVSSIAQFIVEYSINTTIDQDEVLSTIVDNILSTVNTQLTPVISSIIEKTIPLEILTMDIDHFIDGFLDWIFSQLSLTQATVTLTIWDGRLL